MVSTAAPAARAVNPSFHAISVSLVASGVADAGGGFNGKPMLQGRFARLQAREIKNVDYQIDKMNIADMTDAKTQDWHVLSELVRGRPIVVERVRMTETGVAIEGAFELPRLAQLSAEDQVFVAAFVRGHGSIKEMEQVFGVSYPTIKARLNRIAASLEFIETDPEPGRAEVLARLARGEISAAEAITELEGR